MVTMWPPLPLGPRTHIRKNFKKLKLGSASQDQSHSISERCFSTTKNALFINRVEIENLEKFKYYDIDCFLKIQLKKSQPHIMYDMDYNDIFFHICSYNNTGYRESYWTPKFLKWVTKCWGRFLTHEYLSCQRNWFLDQKRL